MRIKAPPEAICLRVVGGFLMPDAIEVWRYGPPILSRISVLGNWLFPQGKVCL